MHQYFRKSFQQILALVLCAAMVLSWAAVPVSAEEAGQIDADLTQAAVEETESAPGETGASVEDAWELPDCDCGSSAAQIRDHGDGCARKAFLKTFSDGSTAEEIYARWDVLPEDCQAFILEYLSWNSANQEKLDTLNALISGSGSGSEEPDTSGSASATTQDGTTVCVTGIPAGSQISVGAVTDETALAAIEAAVAAREDTSERLFAWDISLQNGEGVEIQPDGTVRVELELPGVTLHKYAQVFVLHVDDSGEASYVEAEVTENGGIAFSTDGFSAFAGFTVDFEYDGQAFSINGYEFILLSELFDALKMPLKVAEVANVEFSDPTLVSVAEQPDGDWLLTSLAPFQTNETLTVTMDDGRVYVVNVTDAAYPQVKIGSDGTWTATNGSIGWYADGDGELSNGWTSDYYWDYSDYWSDEKTIYVSGSGTLTITINPASYASSYKVNICQINVDGGAHVKVVLGDGFDTIGQDCIIQNMDDRTMFQVYKGSLEIRGRQNGGKLIIDGHGASASKATENPHIRLNADATKLIVTDTIFRDGKEGAIRSRANDLNEFTVKRCTFESTVKRSGDGGAIYIFSNTADTEGNYVDIHDFEVSSCTFSSNTATGYGGAMALRGYIHKGLISNCTFTGCKSTGQHGGAIDMSGNMGSITVKNCTFTDCTAKYRGGAVVIRSTAIKNSSDKERWTRSNSVTFTGCTFTNCKSTESHGGGIAVQAQIHTLSVSDCDFNGCTAYANGGGISIDAQELPDTFKTTDGPDWAATLDCETCTDYGTTMTGNYDWKNLISSTNTVDYKSWINTVSITDGCTFTNCSATGEIGSDGKLSGGNGGAIEFAQGCYIKNKATVANATIDKATALGEGSAIFWSFCYVKSMAVTDSVFQNCSTGDSEGPGGTVKVTGNTCIVLDVQRCQFLNNYSHQHGGGLYWNAARIQDGQECEATVNDCLFQGNSAALYGGGIYTESKMTITKCHIKENTAYMGGGIAQQVYNNAGARMLDAGGVTELKLDPNTWVHHNTANLGGGVSIRANETDSITDGSPIAYTVRFELNGAAVYQNKAEKKSDGTCGHGGGIYFITESFPNDPVKQAEVDKYTKVILINAGTGTAAAVYNNTAAGNGGGVYMESSENTELHVKGGHISSNIAGGNGGGIYMTGKNATCYVEGGTIGGEGNDSAGNPLANKAVRAEGAAEGGNGGGIAISGGAKIQMTGGTISYNTASEDGGGIWLDALGEEEGAIANSIEISNGSITNNSATKCGGGVCLLDSSNAQLTGGSVENNYAYRGAGIYAKAAASITLTNGTIHHNTAGYLGGGIMANNAKVTVEGGEIYENAGPNSGGGIYAESGSTIVVSGGSIYKNTATKGWGAGIYANNADTSVTVSGGDIYENEASGCGGGINVEGSAELEILGGSIYKNTAGDYGGGIHSYNNSTITMKGGSIFENTAGKAGGGISLRKGSTALVTTNSETGSVGKITKNNAARGGGVSVESGAELTVTGGYITYNKAVGACTQTSAIGHNTSLKGTGGGIYIADGNSDEDPAKFTLTGGEIAIYGNLADYAADDVFANGDNTLLDVPQKAEMNLADYEFDPEGWFEDYPKDDSDYESGLSLAAPESGITNGNVERYREAAPTERVLISDNIVDSMVNVADKYVCMTLGIPAAVSDTVVIDFGLPVDIKVLVNEQMTIANANLVGIGAARAEKEGVDFSKDQQLSATSLKLSFGQAELINDGAEEPEKGVIRYTPSGTEMNGTDTFSYAVKYTNSDDGKYYYYYANVTVIPATTIYYEDSFVSYSVWNVKDDSLNTDSDKQWADTPGGGTANQEEDRPGDAWANGVDANNIYGYDEAYDDMSTHSMGSAKKVTVNEDLYAEAQFTFWGTGFDLISMTSGSTGAILVEVYKTSDFKQSTGDNYNADRVKSILVDTYYGCKYVLCNVTYVYDGDTSEWVLYVDSEADESVTSEKKANTAGIANPVDGQRVTGVEYAWIADPTSTESLYQVPVVKVDGLTYDRYTVVITASYRPAMDHQEKGSYEFYLDAIRIYDPANDGVNTDGTVNETIQGAYVDDGEGWPEYFELRDLLIAKNDFDSLADGTGSGIVFIDNTLDADNKTSYSVSDYTNYGPNNELYLAPGQAVTFDLAIGDNVAGIHLGMKTVGGTTNVNVYDAADTNKTSVTPTAISTATDLYYDITSLNNKTVVIQNTGTGGVILSITNVKVTYQTAHTDGLEDTFFTTTTDSVEAAVLSMSMDSGTEAPAPEETVPETTEPETTEPETTEPEDTVPETTEPEETAPETTVPEETVPEVTEPEEDGTELFVPEKFRVELSGRSVKVGSKVVLTVTSSADVDYITVNGVIVTEHTANRRTGTRTWRVRITAEEAGELEVKVTGHNADGLASETVTKTVKVTQAHSGVGSWLEDMLIGFFDGLWNRWR